MRAGDWGASQEGGRPSTQIHRQIKDLNVTHRSSYGPHFSAKQLMNYLLVDLLTSFFNIILRAIMYQVPTMCQALLNTLCISLLIPHKNTVRSYHPHFKDEETEVQCSLSVIFI